MTPSAARYPRRILIVTQYFWPERGAPPVRYEAIARTLLSLGVEVDVLTGIPNYPSGRIHPGYSAWRAMSETHNGVRIQRLPLYAYGGHDRALRLVNWASFTLTSLAGAITTRRADLVMAESPPLPLVLSAAAIARRHGAPLVMYAADLWPDVAVAMGVLAPGLGLDVLRGIESLCYRLAWRVTVPTEGLRGRLLARPDIDASKVVMLPNGVDPAVFRPMAPEDAEEQRAKVAQLAGRRLFIYAGTMGHAQGLDVIVDTAALLAADPRVGFVLVGDGPYLARLRERASERSLRNMAFVGSVPAEDVPRYLALAYATVAPLRDLPLFSATRPAKILPSLACGKPVIFCGRGEMAEILDRSDAGIVVPPEDAAALASAIVGLVEDPSRASGMGERGRELALREFDFPKLVTRWLDEISRELPPRARST